MSRLSRAWLTGRPTRQEQPDRIKNLAQEVALLRKQLDELQGDERYLWVGNNADKAGQSGVTVIDTADLEPVAFIATGAGHHEIAFSEGDRYAFVTNRDGASISVIDVQKLEKLTDIETGPRPMSIAYSTLGDAVYVTDADSGVITVIDPDQHTVRARIETEAGIGPLRFEKSGGWGMTVNANTDSVFVIDSATNQLAHSISVGDKPYQVNFTNSFAYVRSLETQDVGLILELVTRDTVPATVEIGDALDREVEVLGRNLPRRHRAHAGHLPLVRADEVGAHVRGGEELEEDAA